MKEKTKQFIKMLQSIDKEELLELEQDLNEVIDDTDDPELINTVQVVRRIIKRINSGGDFQKAIRDGVHDIVHQNYQDHFVFSKKHLAGILTNQEQESLSEKQNQIYGILDSLQDTVSGNSIKEATHVFTTILDIVSQICTRKSDGIISVKIRLDEFFRLYEGEGRLKPEYKRVVNLHFSPEEVTAMQMRMPEMKKDDPMTRFFTHVLYQAYDIVRFNEMTGNLLIIMSGYFIEKIAEDDEKLDEFISRNEKVAAALNKAVEDLCDVEDKINAHLKANPILTDFPKYIRALFNQRLGLYSDELPEILVKKIALSKEEYSRIRSTVAFDFDLLPSVQHGIFARQNSVLELQKDVVTHLHEKQEEEIASVKKELDRINQHIETRSKELVEGSPEYNELMNKKRLIEKRIEESRRRMDVLRSQFSLIDLQKTMVNDAIKRSQAANQTTAKARQPKVIRPTEKGTPKKKSIGMVNPKKLDRGR